ncbi:MAG TPA: hypothetical protein VGM75_09920 [Pseudonocardiaceae bacterium]|jgi:hypothetical protein
MSTADAQDVWNHQLSDPVDPARSWSAGDLLKWANAGANEVQDVPINLLNAKVATADGKATYSVAQHLSWSTHYAQQAANGVAVLEQALAQVQGIGAEMAKVAEKIGVVHEVVATVAAAQPAPDSTAKHALSTTPAWPTEQDANRVTAPQAPLVAGLLVSWIRTVVPSVWGAAIGFAISLGVIPTDLVGTARDVGTAVIVPICISAFYAVARWLETRKWAPRKLVIALLGSASAPRYRAQAPASTSTEAAPVAA